MTPIGATGGTNSAMDDDEEVKPPATPIPATCLPSMNWEKKYVMGELFFGGHFVSNEMTQEEYETMCPFIEVKESSLAGKGVFATSDLKPQFLTPYPGEIRPISNVSDHESSYTLQLFNGWYADAQGLDQNHTHVGHLLNSSNPILDAPFKEPTCVYLSVLVTQPDGTMGIKGAVWLNKSVTAGTELLCDYHWMLDPSRCICINHLCIEERGKLNSDDSVEVSPYSRRLAAHKVLTPIPAAKAVTKEDVRLTPRVTATVSEASPYGSSISAMRKVLTPISNRGLAITPISNKRIRSLVRTHNDDNECDSDCDEEKCGFMSPADSPTTSVYSEDSGISKKAGKGLYSEYDCDKKTKVGNFGGQLLCAICARKRKKKDGKEGKYRAVEVEKDYGFTHELDGVVWYLYRTGDENIDGLMWYINSSRKANKAGYNEPNVFFQGCGFYDDGTPAVEVFSLKNLLPNEELLASYMK